jgi:hypothetical protein
MRGTHFRSPQLMTMTREGAQERGSLAHPSVVSGAWFGGPLASRLGRVVEAWCPLARRWVGELRVGL